MRCMKKAADALIGIVLLLILTVIITCQVAVNSTGGILFMFFCLGVAALLLRVIDGLQDEIERQKKIARMLRYEQRLGQSNKTDVA